MSLIVARKDQSKIYIVSDTKLTVPTGQTFNKGQQVSAGETVIKTTIINPLSCISFAGNVAFAETALKIISPGDSIKEVTDKLLASHLLADHVTDYIYAVIEEGNPYIFEIKNGRCQPTESTWVGSQPAFSRFQSYMLGEHKKSRKQNFLSLTDADSGDLLHRMTEANLVIFFNDYNYMIGNNRAHPWLVKMYHQMPSPEETTKLANQLINSLITKINREILNIGAY